MDDEGGGFAIIGRLSSHASKHTVAHISILSPSDGGILQIIVPSFALLAGYFHTPAKGWGTCVPLGFSLIELLSSKEGFHCDAKNVREGFGCACTTATQRAASLWAMARAELLTGLEECYSKKQGDGSDYDEQIGSKRLRKV
jgi:hypothetical protein